MAGLFAASLMVTACGSDGFSSGSKVTQELETVNVMSLATLPAGWQLSDRSAGYLFGSCSGSALYKDMPPLEAKFFTKGSPNPGPTAMMEASQYRVDSRTLESVARRIENCDGEIDRAMTALMRISGDGPVVLSDVSEISLGVRSTIPVRAFRIFAPGTALGGARFFSVVYVALIGFSGGEGSVVEFWTTSQGSEQQYLNEFVEVMRRVLSS